MKEALIIFVKNPEKGKVKTRLAAKAGNEKALEIYMRLLEHTRSIVTSLVADKFVFYSDTSDYNDLWENNIFNKKVQLGNDLGEKITNAFKEILAKEYQKVSIIGSDCFELTADIIHMGFKQLDSADVVIGPAADGGYYFLGIKKIHPSLLDNIAWSTNKVFEQSIAVCNKEQLTYKLLPLLNDIDEEADWIKAQEYFSL